jgi:hypothetical protein
MFISQTGLTYFYKWQCKIQIMNLIKSGSGICNRCAQRLFLLATRFFHLALSLWNQGIFSVVLELCTGAGVPELRHILPEPELRHILPEPELENSGKNSGRQNYEKLFHISMNFW